MLDEQKAIIAQSCIKVIEPVAFERRKAGIDSSEQASEKWIEKEFRFCSSLILDFATIPEEDEWINMKIPITKEFWNQTPQNQTKWITEWGKPMPVLNKVGRKEWFIFVQKKNVDKFKQVMSDFESSFKTQDKIEKVIRETA